jgi:hypothetical protein
MVELLEDDLRQAGVVGAIENANDQQMLAGGHIVERE